MTVSSAKLCPELQHWFHTLVVSSAINKNQVPSPVDIESTFQPQNSFIELLFNDSYSGTTYEYLYNEAPSWGCVPSVAVNRLNLYPGAKYLKLDSTGTNFFNLQSDDFTLLNAMLQYRQDSTSILIVDTTAITQFALDTTANIYILRTDYSILSTALSKLMYLYLDLKIRGNTARYNNTTLIGTTLLEFCYETFVMDEFFKVVSARGT